MAARTVRDCDRCGKPDIREGSLWRIDRSGKQMTIDLCSDCRAAMFEHVLYNSDEKEWCSLVGVLASHRNSTAKHHGATPFDLRP